MSMTPNKLPPLPERKPGVDRLWDTQWMNIVNHADCWMTFTKEDAVAQAVLMTEQKMAENFAEALRHSQSLPAGAVAGLVGKWRERVPADAPDSARVLMREHCADELEQALQADAREKGEVDGWRVGTDGGLNIVTPYGHRVALDESDMSEQGQAVRSVLRRLATQPAQASEVVEGAVAAHAKRAFKNCIRELRQLQDEAKDFDFDEMTVQALQTGIESIELRIATSSQETASE